MMKKCPYCAEEIQEEAVKCRYCLEYLDESKRPAYAMPPMPAGSELPWYSKTGTIILAVATFPPFAIPLIWLHPKLHPVWKVVITILIGLLSWWMYQVILDFSKQIDEAKKMLEGAGFKM